MAISMEQQMMSVLPQLRFQPTQKRVRVRKGDLDVVDTRRAVLIWEPMRVVASYAVPESDIAGDVVTAADGPEPDYQPVGFGPDSPPLLDPSVPFAVHTADGEPVTITTPAGSGAGFRFADTELAGYVVLDFDDFQWWEEDEPIVGHPRDPFHRIDVRRSSRRIRIEYHGTVLAESDHPHLLFEGTFPMPRYYLPRSDVRVELEPGSLQTTCAYKGHATHYTAVVGDQKLADIAWSYPDPLDDAVPVKDLICFYQERLDVFLDGERVEKVRTPWS